MTDSSHYPLKVSYEHKTVTSINQPDDVTRAKASAWLDLISPITQWAGLKGDALHHKRELMRLEREESLFEIARRLGPKLEGKTVTAIPAKQLIPALEKASLETPDSEFIERWANLLASAATTPGDDVGICTSILSELGPTEAALLERAKDRLFHAGLWPNEKAEREIAWRKYAAEHYRNLGELIADHIEGKLDLDATIQEIAKSSEKSPSIITEFHFSHHLTKQEKTISLQFSAAEKIAIDVLKYRNLVVADDYWEVLDFGKARTRPFRGSLVLTVFHLTDLCIVFLKRVSPVAEGVVTEKA